MPIDVKPSSDGGAKDVAVPSVVAGGGAPVVSHASSTAVAIPTDEEISQLGADRHDTYGKITEKILSQNKISDLGDMSAKLTELVAVSKGFNPSTAKHGFLSKALGVLRSEREQVLAHTESVQRQVNAMVGELDKIADRQRDRIKDMGELQGENLAYMEDLKADAARAKGWLGKVEAARATPVDPSDPAAAAKGSALERADQRLQAVINDLGNATTLAKQQAVEIQMTKDNSSAILEEFVKTKTIIIPALQSVLAQYLVGLEQKRAVTADNVLRDTLAEAMQENAQLTGENAVALATLQQKSMIKVETLEQCQTLLEGAAVKIREIEEAGRTQRAQDATKRAEIERRMLGQAPGPPPGQT